MVSKFGFELEASVVVAGGFRWKWAEVGRESLSGVQFAAKEYPIRLLKVSNTKTSSRAVSSPLRSNVIHTLLTDESGRCRVNMTLRWPTTRLLQHDLARLTERPDQAYILQALF